MSEGQPIAKRQARFGPGKIVRKLVVWPMKLAWRTASLVEKRLGIILTLLLGGFFTLVGLALASTFIGMIFGLPITAVGLLLLVRALY